MSKRAMVALGNGFREDEMVCAMHIDMLETQRSYVFHVLRSNLLPAAPPFFERILHIPGIPEHDHIHDKPQHSQLILLPLAIPLTQLTSLAMKHMTGDTVPSLATIQLRLNASAEELVP